MLNQRKCGRCRWGGGADLGRCVGLPVSANTRICRRRRLRTVVAIFTLFLKKVCVSMTDCRGDPDDNKRNHCDHDHNSTTFPTHGRAIRRAVAPPSSEGHPGLRLALARSARMAPLVRHHLHVLLCIASMTHTYIPLHCADNPSSPSSLCR